jgi:uncharacterized protein (DUF1499 family)
MSSEAKAKARHRAAFVSPARFLAWGLALVALLALLALLVFLRNTLIGENPFAYHVDPLSVERTGSRNDFLIAPAGFAETPPDVTAPAFDATPDEVMAAFNGVAMSEPRVTIVAGDPSLMWMTVVQRSRLLRFSDYVSMVAVALQDGRTSIAIYSRSAYGGYDWGVNEARLRDWLAKLREALKPIEDRNRIRRRT